MRLYELFEEKIIGYQNHYEKIFNYIYNCLEINYYKSI